MAELRGLGSVLRGRAGGRELAVCPGVSAGSGPCSTYSSVTWMRGQCPLGTCAGDTPPGGAAGAPGAALPSSEAWAGRRAGGEGPSDLQQRPEQGPAPGEGQPQAPAGAGGDLLGGSSAGKGPGVLVGSKVPMASGVPCGQGASGTLGGTRRSVVASRSREGVLPSALPWWGRTWSAGSSAGLPSSTETGSYWGGASGGYRDDGGTEASPW